jgi:hypothetical protein
MNDNIHTHIIKQNEEVRVTIYLLLGAIIDRSEKQITKIVNDKSIN